ncbi:hypothetical protein P154DRAFT_23980 [Amniculicola lignicola CBS 123094]|uniref:F-box domain-containing protein n=1 Tax=Amniculicola lignicola CBS 123094 TaxID=1392246 RepID=A0A6A5WXU9_9PLEO|nr:hypothetical protein P154DRAFT_23980 [Amniculicola lignicola CBS 123094]
MGPPSLFPNMSLSWNLPKEIPPQVLETFHAHHPPARLHVQSEFRLTNPLDKLLLSSPQLYSLRYEIYFNHPQIKEKAMRMLFHTMKNCLKQGGSIKKLHIEAMDNIMTSVRHGAAFPFRPLESFPPLEELYIGYQCYDIQRADCRLWRDCMDWTCLKTLDLGGTSPVWFIKSITGAVPQLRVFKCGTRAFRDPNSEWSCWRNDTDVIPSFLESIDALECLEISPAEGGELQFQTRILRKCGPPLKSLRLATHWCDENFEELQHFAPNVEDLKVSISEDVINEPESALRALTALSKLKHIVLHTDLSEDNLVYIEMKPDERSDETYSLRVDEALNLILSLFEACCQSSIEDLTVIFQMPEVETELDFRIERAHEDSKGYKVVKTWTQEEAFVTCLAGYRDDYR